MQQIFLLLVLFNSTVHVLGDKFAHPQEHFFNCIYSFWYNASTLLPTGVPVDKVALNGSPTLLRVQAKEYGSI